ncbi:MAG: peptidoglycan-binding protein [Actinobacteria bacterium]|nr:peptidoglycan-binding protein [Actinomycetota bacterium]
MAGGTWSGAGIERDLRRARTAGLVDVCLSAEAVAGLPRGVLLAVASRETGCRNIVGDHGHGRGVFQIDDRFHVDWLRRQGVLGRGRVPTLLAGARFAAQLLTGNLREGKRLGLVRDERLLGFALSAYNAGVSGAWAGLEQEGDSDARTTGRDYGADVLRRLGAVLVWLADGGGDRAAIARPVLRRGMEGPEVRELERRLAAWFRHQSPDDAPVLRVDGRFDEGLVLAVRRFQRANGLVVDGIAGPQVWGALADVAHAEERGSSAADGEAGRRPSYLAT